MQWVWHNKRPWIKTRNETSAKAKREVSAPSKLTLFKISQITESDSLCVAKVRVCSARAAVPAGLGHQEALAFSLALLIKLSELYSIHRGNRSWEIGRLSRLICCVTSVVAAEENWCWPSIQCNLWWLNHVTIQPPPPIPPHPTTHTHALPKSNSGGIS